MANNFMLRWVQRYADRQRALGLQRCNDWIGQAVAELAPESLVDVGCGDGDFLFRYLKKTPRDFYGIEGSASRQAKAEKLGIKIVGCDLNGRWPFEDGKFDVVFSSQAIEHLHNTRMFVEEAYRVLKPGGTAIIASENLCSLLNCFALCLGFTPFSLMQVCGRYLGNPLGLHYQEPHPSSVPIDHPAFSGITGHNRVMTVRQARELFVLAGFDTDARSVSILPLPDRLSRMLEGAGVRHRGHFLVLRARKPRQGA
jgi:SAM-dependent methyltransferase